MLESLTRVRKDRLTYTFGYLHISNAHIDCANEFVEVSGTELGKDDVREGWGRRSAEQFWTAYTAPQCTTSMEIA
jgi:adenylate cyclase class IV